MLQQRQSSIWDLESEKVKAGSAARPLAERLQVAGRMPLQRGTPRWLPPLQW